MANKLKGKRIAILCTNGVQQDELTKPWEAARDEGAQVDLIAPKPGYVQAERHKEKTDRFEVTRTFSEADPYEYDGLILPGGVVNADDLRMESDAVKYARTFFDQSKPVAVICHGPWLLVEADVVRGRTLTSWPSLQTDIRNAGGTWVDEEVHVDGNLVSSRKPDDLPAFIREMIKAFA
jgi:protease I